MKHLLRSLKAYRAQAVLAPLFKMLEATFDLLVPVVVAKIVNHLGAKGDPGYVWQMGGLLLLMAAVGLGLSVTAQYFAARAAIGTAADLRGRLFRHIQRLGWGEADALGTSTLITRMTSDMNQVQTGLNLALRLLLRSPFVVFGAMIMAFTIDARAALWFAAAIPALSLVVFGIMLVSIPLYRKVQGLLDRVLGATRENLTGVRVLRAFGKEDSETEDFRHKN